MVLSAGKILHSRRMRVQAGPSSGDLSRSRDGQSRLLARAAVALEATVGGAESTGLDVALARAWVAWLDGDISLTAESLPADELRGQVDHLAELAFLAGVVHRERNRLAPALARLQEAGAYGHNVIACLAASELARCHQAAGATMDGLELAVSTRASCPGLPPAVDIHLRITEARIRLADGDLLGAQALVRAAPQGIDAQLLAARVALPQAPTRAARLLESVKVRTPRQAVEKLLLRAQLPEADSTEASTALIRAVSDGEPLGLVRTFLDEGPALCRRLEDLALESDDRAVGRIAALACSELASVPMRESTPPIEQLTVRELAVLRMLRLRLSNREMAARMYISVNRVKTYIRTIYRKLGVPHRLAAVRRARALELV